MSAATKAQAIRYTDAAGNKWRLDEYDAFDGCHYVACNGAYIGRIEVEGELATVIGCGDDNGRTWTVLGDARSSFAQAAR